MKVKEIMTKDVVSIKPDDSAQDALALLFKMQISGLPVIDAQGKSVGMFTEKDVLSYVLPSYIEKVGRFIYAENPKSTKKKFMELGKITVSKLMRHKVIITTFEDTALCEVVRIMLIQKARRLLVVDKAGKVVGIVARQDVLKALVKEAEDSKQI
jgi:predicted transcriptional regulator